MWAKRLALIAIVFGVFTSGIEFANAAPAGSIGSKTIRVRTLVTHGDYDAARDLLVVALGARSDAALHRAHLEGLILLHQRREEEALDLFRFILSREPDFTPARIELSKALAARGDSGAALHQLQIIELGSHDPQIRRQARAFGDDLKSRRPYGFSGYFGFLPSTNINKGSRHSVAKVGDLAFAIDKSGRERSGIGLTAGGNAYRRTYLAPTSWLTAAGAVDLKKYSSNADYDELALSADLTLSRRFGRTTIELGPTGDYRLLGWEPYATRYGLTASIASRVGAHTGLHVGGTCLKQVFSSASYRDGWICLGYAGVRQALSPSTAISIVTNFAAERTHRDHLDHDDAGLTAQFDREWRGGLVTGTAIGIGMHDYRGNIPGLGETRRDTLWTAGLSLLNRNWSFKGLTPKLEYSYLDQKSNIAFYDYGAHELNLTFTKNF